MRGKSTGSLVDSVWLRNQPLGHLCPTGTLGLSEHQGMSMRTRHIDPAEERIGERIKRLRERHGLSQRQLASMIGKDHRTLGRIESGETSCDNRHTLTAIAAALGRPLADLTGAPTIGGRDGAVLIQATTATLNAFVHADLDFAGDQSQVRPVDVLERDVVAAVRRRVACEYIDLARMLPALVGALYATATVGPAGDRKSALALFVRAAEAASMGARYSGNTGAAAMIAERAWYAAQLAGDPKSLALAAWTRAHAALGCGQNERAWKLAEAGADRLSQAAQVPLPMLGMLHLTSAFAQTGMGSYGGALAPLGEAANLAERTGETTDDGLFFGPTNVVFWRVAIDLDGGEPDEAIRVGTSLDPERVTRLASASRQSAFHADLGRAFGTVGNTKAAVARIRLARRVAPLRIDADPYVQEAVRALVADAHRRAVPRELASLAEQMHVPI